MLKSTLGYSVNPANHHYPNQTLGCGATAHGSVNLRRFFLTPFPGVEYFRLLSGSLRYAAPTGYYLTAFQAGTLLVSAQCSEQTSLDSYRLPKLIFASITLLFNIGRPSENVDRPVERV
jgi:hypothetical protein